MAILGGDDAGGGVTWAPQVIEDAAEHGLILGENGRLYDSENGEVLPDGIKPMPVLSSDVLSRIPEPTATEFVSRHVARYQDLMSLAANQTIQVIGEDGELKEELAMIEHQDQERRNNSKANSNASEVLSSCESKAITNNPMKFMMNY